MAFPRLRLLALLLTACLSPASAQITLTPVLESTAGAAPAPGVLHELAIARAARLTDLHYSLSFVLIAKSATTKGHETLTFTDSGTGDLPIDFRDGDLNTASLNGHELLTQTVNGHIILPAAALVKGANKLEVDFKANVASAGKAITRYEDKDDGSEYLYTLFVPMDADMAFPCFDQPDLKARFTLTVDHPNIWNVISNTAAPFEDVDSMNPSLRTSFPETQPISTYLFAFAAGPFERIAPTSPGEPALYVRKSQLKRAQAEAPAVQQITAKGIGYLQTFFAQPFPFPKYDLVLIPGFPFGGMEHAGATFLNEDGVLFRSAPTQSDYFRRDTLILHETTHQWFGDLVTMRWFDDLWLKEGFAQYMAYKALAALKPETQPWKHFAEDIKPLAYGIDETQGTTPIFQNIPNLKDAKSAYGAIVYQKAPAVLKQLNFKLGDDVFRDGLRLYLKQHAYANATWPDLIGAFTAAGGKGVQSWADAWILRRGMPEVTAEFTCVGNRLGSIKLRQHDVLGTDAVWPISEQIYLKLPPKPADQKPFDLPYYEMEPIRLDWNIASLEVTSNHSACPLYLFANDEDQAYGRFLLDPTSQANVALALKANDPQPPLLHTLLWTALWENVRTAKASPRSYVELALQTLTNEPDESINRIQGGRIAASLHAYLGPQSRAAILPQAEKVIADRMLHAPTLGLRIVNFRTFTSIAETPAALAELKQILAGTLTIEGLQLRPLDRWNLIGHLIAQSDPDAQSLFKAERQNDKSGEALKYAYAVQAASPQAKAQYWNDYLHNATLQEDWITQSLGNFSAWNQSGLTLPYLAQALDQLPEIKLHRKIFFLGAWLSSFIGDQHSAESQTIVHTWLARKDIDPDLRLKVLEASDPLDRTVRIRKTYPD